MAFHVPERFRITEGKMASGARDGNNGLFRILCNGTVLRALASDGGGWEHVSVSLAHRAPTWGEMCTIKDLFWSAEDVVMQLHPRRSEYVNQHPHCLHLWRPTDAEIPTPPPIFVGLMDHKGK